MTQTNAPDAQPSEIRFHSGDTALYAVERGSGPPLILLHGGLANHLACAELATALAPHCRVITPDLRASGRSVYTGALSWDQLADDIAALLTHLGLDRAVVGGASFGAGCAVRFALRHPGRASALILITPAHAGAEVGLTPAQQAAFGAMDAAGSRVVAEGIEVLYPLFAPLPAEIRTRALAMVDDFDPPSVAASTRFIASGAQPFDSAAALAAITAPTLLIPGDDIYHPSETSDLYATHVPGCTVRRATGGDITAAVIEHLDRIRA